MELFFALYSIAKFILLNVITQIMGGRWQ